MGGGCKDGRRRGAADCHCAALAGPRAAASPPSVLSPLHALLRPCRAFNEVYLPALNDLPAQRLENEFATLRAYLGLLRAGMAPEAARANMVAYVRAVVAKAAR